MVYVSCQGRMRANVMQITSNCQNYIFLTPDFLCYVQGSEIDRDVYTWIGFR